MTFWTSLFAENRDSLAPKKTKQKVCAATALALLVTVGGTAMVQNTEAQPSREVSTAISGDFARAVSTASIATVNQPANVQYRTTIDLNMRTGPGTQYGIINYGPRGTTVTGTGKTSGIWYQVKMGSQTGWMSSEYLQKITVQAPASNTSTGSGIQYKTTIQLNLRAGAGTQYKVLGYGVAGTTVTGTGKTSGIWYEVKMGSQTGWMSSDYLQDITGPNTMSALQSYAGSKLNNPAQLKCLVTLWNRESNWNYRAINSAYNPSKPSTPDYQAYGIAQAAPGNKMATSGADWLTNPRTQINWGLDYIKGRYGTPCKALDHSYAVGWY
jgi:uncharacterized protein YraI